MDIPRTTRTVFGAVGLVFAMAVIAFVTWRGSPENSLHSSALSWAWFSFLGVLVAFGASVIVDIWRPKQ